MALRRLRQHEQRRADSCWAWVVCVASFVIHFLTVGQLNSFGPFFVALLKEFRRSEAETAWICSLAIGTTFFLAPVSIGLCARWGCRVVTCAGSVLLLAGMVLTSVVEEMLFMYITYGLLVGVASSFLYFGSFTAISQYFFKHLPIANGIMFAGSGCGTLALTMLTNRLFSRYDYKIALRLLACLSLPLFIAGLTFSPVDNDRTVDKEKTRKEERVAEKTTSVQKLVDFLRPSKVFHNKAFVVWTAALVLILFCYYIPYMYLARLAEDVGIPSSQGAMLVGFCALAQTVGKFTFGKLADFRSLNRVLLSQSSLLVIAVATALLPLAQSYSALVTFCVVSGFFDGGFVTMLGLVVYDIVGREMMAKAVGTMYGVVALPLTIGPPVAGRLYDSFGNCHVMFLLCSGLITAGICLMFLVPRLMPVMNDDKKALLLSEIPVTTTAEMNDERKQPESLPAQHDTAICYEEFVENFSVQKKHLLLGEPSQASRPSSFILFSIIPQDSLRDLSEHAPPRDKSRNAASLSLCKASSQKLIEGIKCDVKLTSINELRQSNGVDGKLITERTPVCFCDTLPEFGKVHNFNTPTDAQEIAVEIETLVSSYAEEVTNGHHKGEDSGMDLAEESLKETRDRCASWNTSGSNISWKNASQASNGTNDTGYIEGYISPYTTLHNFEENSESTTISQESLTASKHDDVCLHCNPLASIIDERSTTSCDSCKCELEEQGMDSGMTNYGDSGDVKITSTNPQFDCSKNELADVRETDRHDYYSDLMESTLERSICTCAEDEDNSADSLDAGSCSLCKDREKLSEAVEPPNISNQVLLEEAHELEQGLFNIQGERSNWKCTNELCSLLNSSSSFEDYSLSLETTL